MSARCNAGQVLYTPRRMRSNLARAQKAIEILQKENKAIEKELASLRKSVAEAQQTATLATTITFD